MMIKVIPIIYSLLLATPSIGESTGKGKLGRLRTEDSGVGRKLKEKTAKAAKAEVGKVKLCHKDDDGTCPWKNIEPSANALKAHLARGDYEGTCDDYCGSIGATYDPVTCTCDSGSMRMLEVWNTNAGDEFGRQI